MESIVTRNGQITLGKKIRQKLNIQVGSAVEINQHGTMIIISKKDTDFWDTCGGALPDDFDVSKLRKPFVKRLEEVGF